MRVRRRALMGATAALIALVAGCGEGTSPPPPVATVAIDASQGVELVPGGTQMLVAIAKDAKGSTLVDRVTTWSTSDPAIATVSAGLVSSVALGTATVTASVEGKTATVEVRVRDGAVVGASGNTFSSASGAVNVAVPAGALSQTTSLTVTPAASPPANARLLSGTAFDFGPASTSFAQPVTLTVKYNPALVTLGNSESELQLYEAVGGAWRVVAGSTPNVTLKTVSGNITNFGTYAVMLLPRVETVTIAGDLTPIPVVTTRQLSATLKDNEGTTLTRPTSWTSSDPAILSIGASTGLASAKVPGSVTITATSEGKSGTATITVVPGPPAKLIAFAGNNQSVAAGTIVPTAPSVIVTDAIDNPIANVAVTFTVASGGGTITGGSATTNASGIAAVGSWTLGTVAGPNSLTATSPVISGVTVTFQAAGGAGPAAKIEAVAGNNQTATAGGLVATRPSVKVTDANGNSVTGFAVTFAPGSGSGSVTGGAAVTDAAGIATVGSWRLGSTPGAQTLTASATGLTGSPVTFNATAAAPVASTIAGFAGNNQTARPAFAVSTPPSVIVTDPAGIPVPGVAVTFAVTAGGGSIAGASATTNANGIATVGSWTLGPLAGPNSLTATAGTLSGSPVTFNATGVLPPPTTLVINAGDNQNAFAGQSVPIAPSVNVTDAEGFRVSGVAVTFTVASGGGTITDGSATTSASGIATVGSWTLGTVAGPNSLTATSPAISGVTVTFQAAGGVGPPAKIEAVTGNNQTATAGGLVATPPSVKVTDANGNSVAGFVVTFAPGSGSGSVTGGAAATDAAGIATVGSWRLGSAPGTQTLTAAATGLTGSPVTFNATGAAAPPTTMVINAGDNQNALAGQPVPIAPSVKVTDAEGFGVPGITVTFSIRSGAGSIAGASPVTNSSGIATLGSWVLGIGGNSLFASVPGLNGDPLVFVALGTAEVQIVTFGDSNTDLGFQGTQTSPQVASYVSASSPALRLGASAPNSTLQLAGKIEARWRANRTKTITAVNHGITGTTTGTGRSLVFAPNALEQVGGVSRFRGEVLGDAYPWSGGEPVNDFYPNGAIQRTQAFKPRTSDFAYISMGTNDIGNGISATAISNNLAIMIDEWIGRGLPANRLLITTLPPRRPGAESANIPDLNNKIRTLASGKGVRLIDIAAFVSNNNGLNWMNSSVHVGDFLHYSEAVRNAIADQVVSIMLALNP